MLTNKIKFLISIILIIIFSSIVFLTVDFKFRRSIFSKLLGGYKLINYHIVGGHAYHRNFKAASNSILNYIELSQKFSSGKNVMLEGIIDSTELISSKALTQEDFNILQEVYIKINEITDDIYKNHIWLARSYSDDDLEKSKQHLNKALLLSKSSEEAYREIIRIFANKHEIKDLIKNYCLNYFKEFAGSSIDRISTAQSENNFFEANNSTIAISKNGNFNNLYPMLIDNYTTYEEYQFFFEKEENLNFFEIFKKFRHGTKISIRNIKIINDRINELDINNLIIQSLGSYILNQTNNEIVFIAGNSRDEIFRFNLNKNIKKIKSISFELKLERLPITNNNICKF